MKLFALLVIFAFGFTACATSTDSTEPANVQAGVVNTLCPLAGTAVADDMVVEYNGMLVGFCCENCMGTWEGMSAEEKDEALAKVKK